MLQQVPTFKTTTTIIVCVRGQRAPVVWSVAELPKLTGLWLHCSLLKKNRNNGMGLVFFFNFLAGFHSSFPVSVFVQLGHNPALFLEMGLVLSRAYHKI